MLVGRPAQPFRGLAHASSCAPDNPQAWPPSPDAPDANTRRGGAPPPRNPHRHGRRLADEVAEAVAVATHIRIVEGVDPGLVFKVRATQRIGDDTFGSRGLTFLGETAEHTYFVFSDDDVPWREAVLTQPLETFTDRTATGPDWLRKELARAVARGYAIEDREQEPHGVAAPPSRSSRSR
jgi:hypothetical protein